LRGGYTNAYQEGWRWGKREDVGAVEVDLEQHGAGTHPARLLLRPYRGLVWRGGWQPALWRWTWSGTAPAQTWRAASSDHVGHCGCRWANLAGDAASATDPLAYSERIRSLGPGRRETDTDRRRKASTGKEDSS